MDTRTDSQTTMATTNMDFGPPCLYHLPTRSATHMSAGHPAEIKRSSSFRSYSLRNQSPLSSPSPSQAPLLSLSMSHLHLHLKLPVPISRTPILNRRSYFDADPHVIEPDSRSPRHGGHEFGPRVELYGREDEATNDDHENDLRNRLQLREALIRQRMQIRRQRQGSDSPSVRPSYHRDSCYSMSSKRSSIRSAVNIQMDSDADSSSRLPEAQLPVIPSKTISERRLDSSHSARSASSSKKTVLVLDSPVFNHRLSAYFADPYRPPSRVSDSSPPSIRSNRVSPPSIRSNRVSLRYPFASSTCSSPACSSPGDDDVDGFTLVTPVSPAPTRPRPTRTTSGGSELSPKSRRSFSRLSVTSSNSPTPPLTPPPCAPLPVLPPSLPKQKKDPKLRKFSRDSITSLASSHSSFNLEKISEECAKCEGEQSTEDECTSPIESVDDLASGLGLFGSWRRKRSSRMAQSSFASLEKVISIQEPLLPAAEDNAILFDASNKARQHLHRANMSSSSANSGATCSQGRFNIKNLVLQFPTPPSRGHETHQEQFIDLNWDPEDSILHEEMPAELTYEVEERRPSGDSITSAETCYDNRRFSSLTSSSGFTAASSQVQMTPTTSTMPVSPLSSPQIRRAHFMSSPRIEDTHNDLLGEDLSDILLLESLELHTSPSPNSKSALSFSKRPRSDAMYWGEPEIIPSS